MTPKRFLTVTVALLVAGSLAAPALANDLPNWVEEAPAWKAFSPLQPSIARRPAVLLETSYYVYGPNTGFDNVEVNITVSDRNYDDPVSLYLYWQDRENLSDVRYYNMPAGGFVNSERDLFGQSSTPVAVLTPDLTDFQLFGPSGAFGDVPNNIPTGVGRYQFVFEVRSANGNQVIARGNAMYNQVSGVNQVGGTVTTSQVWDSDTVIFMASPTNFDGGATLTIEPGTVILGSQSGQGTLVIRQGATINAEGTEDLPIIFTSELPVGQRGAGDWGGLVINGNAPTNQQNPQGEGDSGPFGGNNANDSSGVLKYVRVEFAGIRFSDQNELNGIALQGVGAGTTIEKIQVHFNQDDGIEFFGGTVNAKYVLITDAQDDSLDWTFGWTGKLQHFVAIQRFNEHDHGIEADNFEDNPSATPRSNPTIYNATFYGNGNVNNAENDDGWRLRRGTQLTIGHSIVTNFAQFGLVTDGDNPADWSGVSITNSFFYNNTNGLTNSPEAQAILDAGNNFIDVNARIPNGNGTIGVDYSLLNSSDARNVGATPPNDGFFDQVNYAGGVAPNDPWIHEGWTTFSDN